ARDFRGVEPRDRQPEVAGACHHPVDKAETRGRKKEGRAQSQSAAKARQQSKKAHHEKTIASHLNTVDLGTREMPHFRGWYAQESVRETRALCHSLIVRQLC